MVMSDVFLIRDSYNTENITAFSKRLENAWPS
ncbi:MAG: hypothetical protein ACI9BD_001550, partial [Candidatus Marinamargulisbacteria bacterium]